MLDGFARTSLMKSLKLHHFAGKVPYMVEKNLSRLASQWEESVRAAMAQVEKIAERRLDELAITIGHYKFLKTALITRFPDFQIQANQ